ncbi:MAG: hypothetical protein ACTSWL_07075, partial [Promethearchaeota archaeon]
MRKKLLNNKKNDTDQRYKWDRIYAKSMEGNPLNSSPYQRLRIYLPPEYFDNNEKSYPVIYIL